MSMQHRVSFQQTREVCGDVLWTHRQPDGGRITVLDRETGFGWRDFETGYKSPCGKFWLASGHQDIRDVLDELSSDDAMAAWVIERANNCIASPPYRGYNYSTHDELMLRDRRGCAQEDKP